MKLGEFIKNFSHNNLIRLLYECEGGHKLVLDIIGMIIFSSCAFNIKDKNDIYYSFGYTPIDEIEKIGNYEDNPELVDNDNNDDYLESHPYLY
jgi:hypothetical protein